MISDQKESEFPETARKAAPKAARSSLWRSVPLLVGGFCVLSVVWSVAQETTKATYGSLSVIATDAVTGQSLRSANIIVQSVTGGKPSSVATDPSGRATIERVEAGRYTLTAQKDGYLTVSYGARFTGQPGRSVTVEPGHAVEIAFQMVPGATIRGRVVDSEGEPVPMVALAYGNASIAGAPPTLDVFYNQTDEEGRYEIPHLEPGPVYVCAIPRSPRRRDPERGLSLLPTCYPKAALSSPAPIVVPPGGVVSGVDITLRSGPTFHIRGKIAKASTASFDDLELLLLPKADEHLPAFYASRSVYRVLADRIAGLHRLHSEDVFDLSGVEPGSYELAAARAGQEGGFGIFGRVDVNLTNRDLDEVVVPLSEAIQLPWVVRVEGRDWQDTSCSCVLNPLDADPAMQTAFGNTGPEGRFIVKDIVPGRYSVSLQCQPRDLFVVSARLRDGIQNQDILEAGLDLRGVSKTASAEVVLSPRSAVVDGLVKSGDTPAPLTWLTLVPEPPGRERLLRVKTAWSDDRGHFVISGVSPGEYRLYVWTRALAGDAFLDPAFLGPRQSSSSRVSVRAGEVVRVEARVSP